jgi:hypothetical protein
MLHRFTKTFTPLLTLHLLYFFKEDHRLTLHRHYFFRDQSLNASSPLLFKVTLPASAFNLESKNINTSTRLAFFRRSKGFSKDYGRHRRLLGYTEPISLPGVEEGKTIISEGMATCHCDRITTSKVLGIVV